jgi:hypothetical protein
MTNTGRNFSRMNINDLGVEISIYNNNDDHSALIDNICLGGIRISSETKFEENSKILLSLNKAKRHYVSGRVRWSMYDEDYKRYRYGLEFISETGEETRVIADFMATLLNMLTKEKVVSKALDLFCSSLSKSSSKKTTNFMGQIKKIMGK